MREDNKRLELELSLTEKTLSALRSQLEALEKKNEELGGRVILVMVDKRNLEAENSTLKGRVADLEGELRSEQLVNKEAMRIAVIGDPQLSAEDAEKIRGYRRILGGGK